MILDGVLSYGGVGWEEATVDQAQLGSGNGGVGRCGCLLLVFSSSTMNVCGDAPAEVLTAVVLELSMVELAGTFLVPCPALV